MDTFWHDSYIRIGPVQAWPPTIVSVALLAVLLTLIVVALARQR